MTRSAIVLAMGIGILGLAGPGLAADLLSQGDWPALAADRTASRVGDSLMVVVYENSQASNSTQIGSRRNNRVTAEATTSAGKGGSVALGANGAFDGGGQMGRSGRMLAQISAVVDQVLPNGDLHIVGAQTLNIGGERTTITLAGRARPADIYQNSIISSRLADVMIDYGGAGYVSRSGRPGVLANIFSWLGVL